MFVQSYFDYLLIIIKKETEYLVVLVYVNDQIISGNNLVTNASFKKYLEKHFYMKDVGVFKYFLEVE